MLILHYNMCIYIKEHNRKSERFITQPTLTCEILYNTMLHKNHIPRNKNNKGNQEVLVQILD